MSEVLAIAALIEQLSLLGTRLLQSAQTNADPTPEEWQAALARAQAAHEQFQSLLAAKTPPPK